MSERSEDIDCKKMLALMDGLEHDHDHHGSSSSNGDQHQLYEETEPPSKKGDTSSFRSDIDNSLQGDSSAPLSFAQQEEDSATTQAITTPPSTAIGQVNPILAFFTTIFHSLAFLTVLSLQYVHMSLNMLYVWSRTFCFQANTKRDSRKSEFDNSRLAPHPPCRSIMVKNCLSSATASVIIQEEQPEINEEESGTAIELLQRAPSDVGAHFEHAIKPPESSRLDGPADSVNEQSVLVAIMPPTLQRALAKLSEQDNIQADEEQTESSAEEESSYTATKSHSEEESCTAIELLPEAPSDVGAHVEHAIKSAVSSRLDGRADLIDEQSAVAIVPPTLERALAKVPEQNNIQEDEEHTESREEDDVERSIEPISNGLDVPAGSITNKSVLHMIPPMLQRAPGDVPEHDNLQSYEEATESSEEESCTAMKSLPGVQSEVSSVGADIERSTKPISCIADEPKDSIKNKSVIVPPTSQRAIFELPEHDNMQSTEERTKWREDESYTAMTLLSLKEPEASSVGARTERPADASSRRLDERGDSMIKKSAVASRPPTLHRAVDNDPEHDNIGSNGEEGLTETSIDDAPSNRYQCEDATSDVDDEASSISDIDGANASISNVNIEVIDVTSNTAAVGHRFAISSFETVETNRSANSSVDNNSASVQSPTAVFAFDDVRSAKEDAFAASIIRSRINHMYCVPILYHRFHKVVSEMEVHKSNLEVLKTWLDELVELIGLIILAEANKVSRRWKKAVANCIPIVVASMEHHNTDLTVQETAYRLITTLVHRNKDCCKALVASGYIPAMVASVKQYPANLELQEKACEMFLIFAQEDRDCCKLIVAAKGVPAVLAAMKEHSSRVKLQASACELLEIISNKTDVCFIAIVAANCIPAVTAAMQRHFSDIWLQERACGLLGNLTVSRRSRKAILAANVIPAVVTVMQKHSSHASVQEEACRLLGNLAAAGDRDCCNAIVSANAIPVVSDIMQHHESHVGLQRNASRLMESLVDEDED